MAIMEVMDGKIRQRTTNKPDSLSRDDDY